VNEYLGSDDQTFSFEELELHYDNLKLGWSVSLMEDYLTALGEDC